ncbi:MAG: alpha-2-macroglobulin family protein [Paracoccaceae bacterium]|nr:alpha-2-macroglobulin family protein [Paracoccaceae bacterium]
MLRFALALMMGVMAVTAAAQESVPDRRLIVTRDMDFYGSDLQALFDTDRDACVRLCLADPQCKAFTFNSRNNACFPKSAVAEEKPYDGAVSARVVEVPGTTITRARARTDDLGFLRKSDFTRARQEAEALGLRHGGGQWTPEALLDAAEQARVEGKLRDAVHWTGAALAQTDDPALWLQYGDLSAQTARSLSSGSDKRRYQRRALLSPINAYLRAGTDPQRITALVDLARALEVDGRGRDMIPTLRLAESIGPRADVTALLDQAIGKYGFRIREHTVEADSARPAICAEFTEDLVRAGQDYTPFVRLPDPRMAIRAEGRRICVTGVEHGARYVVTFREGLPAASGEELIRDVSITAYVRDRSPKVGFPGRAYVLPKSADAGLPIETVNLSEVDLVLRRVSDRNLIRSIQDDFFGRPVAGWRQRQFSEDIAEEVWRGTAEVENRLNADVLTRLPMGEAIAGQPAGIYALTAKVPGSDPYDDDAGTQWFVLSDIGLTTLAGSDGLTVFARALGSAAPMQGLEVTLLSSANGVLGTTTTDADGVARFAAGLTRGTGGAAPALVTARQGEDDLAFLSLSDPAFDLSDRGVEGRAPAGPIDAFLTTDRGAYRAGEVIYATTLLRDAGVAAVKDVPLTAVLTRPDGVEYSRHVSTNDTAGGHVFDLPVAASAPRGTWRLAVYGDPDAEALASQTVLVEDFVPERIDFDLTLPEGPIQPLSPPLLQVDARYLFGAPGADLPIEGEVLLSASDRLEAFPGYRFGRHDKAPQTRYASFPGDLRTDADGRASLPIPLPSADDATRPQTARVTLRISEGSGRPVERSISRSVAPASPMIGIRPLFDDTLPEGSEAGFDVIALGPDLQPTQMPVRWQINRVNTRYQWYRLYGNWNWEPVTTRTTVASGTGNLGADPLRVTGDVDWGQYELVVERTDGTYAAASVGFDAGWYAPADAAQSPDTLELSLDQPSYAPGDTAQLRIVPRYAGQALVTVLADRVISMQAVKVSEGENLLSLPVTEEWGAGVYVTAQVLRPMDVAAGHNPARSLGLTHAGVDPGARQLTVTIDTAPEIAPRGPMTAAVQIDGLSGGQGYVTLAAVDLGILNLTGFESPDPSGHYFGQRRLGVEIRDLYGRLIDGMNGAMGTIRSGGDGAAGMRMQSPPPTEKLVAFFSGPVTADATGRAEVAFDMPDFNGTVRLMAVAWSDSAVGQAEADVLVRDPVVISAAVPRFLAPGDTSRLQIDLTHTTGPSGDMQLAVSADGVTLAYSAPTVVSLRDQETARLTLPLSADEIGDHGIEIALTTPDGQRLTKSLTLGVRANDPAVGTTRRFSLAPGQTFSLDDNTIAGLRPGGASVLISAGALARFDAPGLLAALDRYPYGCTEQVTSQALPLLYMSSVAEPLGLGNPQRIGLRIRQSITQVLNRQASNGAFGLWRADSGDFWLDAYVSDFLSRARIAGHAVPDQAFASAMDNLRNRIAYAPDFDKGGEDIAYALLVLAREGQAAMGDLRYYADEKSGAFATPLALAQLGAALAAYGDQRRADLMFAQAAARLAGPSESEAQLWRADYGTHLRDAAGILSLAVEARSDAVDREALTARIAGTTRPLSTQEQAWALLAAHAMVQEPGLSGLSVNGTPVEGPFLRRYGGADLSVTTEIANTSSAPTNLTLTSLGVPDGPTEASGYGYSLTREYFTMEGDAVSGPVTQGARMVVVLTIRPAEDTGARLIIDDPLPAGYEIDNPSLLRAGDIRALDWLEVAEAEHAEFRTDRFLAAVNQRDAETIRLAYIVRAVSPGAFNHPAALVEDMYRPEYRATTASSRVTIAQ